MMSRSEKKMGSFIVENRRFREFFGVGPDVALLAWNMMCSAGSLPEGGILQHWLWTLCFLKVSAKQGPLCALCGGAGPKTVHKWVWLFIDAFIWLFKDAFIALESEVVSHQSNGCSCHFTIFSNIFLF